MSWLPEGCRLDRSSALDLLVASVPRAGTWNCDDLAALTLVLDSSDDAAALLFGSETRAACGRAGHLATRLPTCWRPTGGINTAVSTFVEGGRHGYDLATLRSAILRRDLSP